jgi:S-(hydroxymethyl)glutathione dehydrogenase/alcohol dehydrogenase
MRAGVVTGVGALSIEDVTMLDPGPNDVVVRVEASGVCHSDISVLKGLTRYLPPFVLGHEGAGVVEAVGADVTRVRRGDRVIASLGPVCGSCWYCERGETQLCEAGMQVAMRPKVCRHDGSEVGALAGLGTFAELMTVHEWSVVPVRTDLPFEELALISCGVTTGLGSVLNVAAPHAGDTAAVIGLGGVGMAVVQGARIAGCSRVIAIDPVASKRQAALALGATDVIDPTDGTAVAQVRELTGGRGVDHAFEAVGAVALFAAAMKMTRRGGTTVIVGVPGFDESVTIKPASVVTDDRTLVGSYYGRTQSLVDLPRYVSLVEAGKLDLSGMVSRRISLDELSTVLCEDAGDAIRSVVVGPDVLQRSS